MTDFAFKIEGDATSADKAIDGVLDGLDDIRKKAASASKSLSRELVGAANMFEDAIEDAAKSSAKAFDTIGLGAQNQLTRIARFNNGFQGLTGRIGAGIGAIDNFAKGLAPWNQALELAGKTIRFVEAGMDAYAKTSAEAASEVAKLKKEFSGYLEVVMAGSGAMAVQLLKPVASFEELRKEMIRVGNTEVYKRLYGGQSINVFEGTDEGGSAFHNLTSAIDHLKDAAREATKLDPWNTKIEDAWSALTKKASTATVELSAYKELLQEIEAPEKQAIERYNLLGQLYMNGAISLERYGAELRKVKATLIDLGKLEVPSVAGALGAPTNYTAGIDTSKLVNDKVPMWIDSAAAKTQRWHEEIAKTRKETEALSQGLGSLSADLVNMAAQGEISFERLGSAAAKLALQIAAMQIGGPWGAFLGSFAGGLSLPGHATGTQFMVGGRGGSDQNIVAFRASGNERVTVETPDDVRTGRYLGGGRQVTQIVVQNDAREVVSAFGTRAGERQYARLNRKFRRS